MVFLFRIFKNKIILFLANLHNFHTKNITLPIF